MFANPGEKMENVWVVIPAFNEGQVIKEVISTICDLNYNIVVVNDCSRDNTAKELQSLPIHVCTHAINLGQGASLQTGIIYALRKGADIIVTFDADGQHDVNDIRNLIVEFENKDVDVVLGSRFLNKADWREIPFLKRLILRSAIFFTKLTTGLSVTDTHNGLRAFRSRAALKIRITQNRMAHASQILSQIATHRLKYVEVPVHIKYTPYSIKKGQKISNAFNILWDSFTEIFAK